MGLESKNFLMNSGSFFIFIIIMILKIIFQKTLIYCAKRFDLCQCLRKRAARMEELGLLGGFNRLLMEEYLNMSFSLFINILDIGETLLLLNGNEDRFANFKGFSNILTTSLTFLFVPIILGYPFYLKKKVFDNIDNLEDELFKEQYGCFYEGLRTNKDSLKYNYYFLCRRLIISISLVFLSEYRFAMIVIFMVLSLVTLAQLLDNKPFFEKRVLRETIINEISIYLVVIICFTFINPSLDE